MQEVNTGSASSSVAGAGSVGPAQLKAPKGFRLKLEQMLAGVEAAIPDGSSITTPAGPMTKAAVVKELTDDLSEFETVDAALSVLGNGRFALRGDLPRMQTFYTELKDGVVATFGKRSPQLAQFGLKPRQLSKPLTPEQRVARAEKARQTRLMRHTGGVRQKAAVQFVGEVDVSTQLRPQPAQTSGATPPAVVTPAVSTPPAEVTPGASAPSKPAATPPASTG